MPRQTAAERYRRRQIRRIERFFEHAAQARYDSAVGRAVDLIAAKQDEWDRTAEMNRRGVV